MATAVQNYKDQGVKELAALAAQQAQVQATESGEGALLLGQPSPDKSSLPAWMTDLLHPTGPEAAPAALAPPAQLGPFNSGAITFNNGVPVGGWMSLTLFQNGNYVFSGHFHDSGAPSYDVDGVWVVVSRSGKAFTFSAKGKTHGTFQSGSRNFDFTRSGNNQEIARAWADLSSGYRWRWTANVNWDVKAAVDGVVSALKAAGAIISVVISVVALV